MSLSKLLDENKGICYDNLGTTQGTEAKIYLDSNVKPICCKAHSVTYVIKRKVKAELERLQKEGIISQVEFSEWQLQL